MEDLTKHQLILLTLLITFITSIGTGIITFTLLSEAPVEITQTINRVVEKTIEQVSSTDLGKPEKTVTTVVVNEEDRVLEAIAKNEKSVVRLRTIGADSSDIFAGIGLVISADGTIVYNLANYHTGASYDIVYYNGKRYPTGKIYIDETDGLVFIKTTIPANNTDKNVFYSAALGNSDTLKIGQTLIAISGAESNAVLIGRIRQLSLATDKKTVSSIISDISILKSYSGSPVLNLSGEIIGLEAPLAEGDSHYSYTPINPIQSAVKKALIELAK